MGLLNMDKKSPSGDSTLYHINTGSWARFCVSQHTPIISGGNLFPLQTAHLFYIKIWLLIFKFLNEQVI